VVVGQSTFSIHSLLSQSRNAAEESSIKQEQQLESPNSGQLRPSPATKQQYPMADTDSKDWVQREGTETLWLSRSTTSPIDSQIDPLQALYRSQLAAAMGGSVSAGAIGSPEPADEEERSYAEGRILTLWVTPIRE
jgi:hypothetical protein